MPDSLNVHAKRPKILHLSGDFPDPINPDKTPVVARLIESVSDRYEHRVISLNRQSPRPVEITGLLSGRHFPVPEEDITPFESGLAIRYLAPPKGLFHATALEKLADWIAKRLVPENAVPDLIVGYKLTIEGLVAKAVADRLGLPFAVVIQGNTDQKILAARPDLANRFRRVYREAASVFSFAPWARRDVTRRLGERLGPVIDLPCPTLHDTIRTPVEGNGAAISVFHLRNHRGKNLAGLAAAFRDVSDDSQPCKMQIYGGGSREETAECAAIIAGVPYMELMGPRSQEELGSIMNAATVFVMPSLRESFGLVFVEALFAGLPIIYPKGASVDGYFDGLPFAIGVNARSKQEISQAIRYAMSHEKQMKAALAEWQRDGGLDRFARQAIAGTFAEGLDTALAGHLRKEAGHA